MIPILARPSLRAALVAMTCMLAACRPARPNYQGAAIVKFAVSHFEGSYGFSVFDDGHAVYASSPGRGPEGEVALASSAKPDELRALAKVLRENRFCSLESSDRPGVP